jgi:hypothetical protein
MSQSLWRYVMAEKTGTAGVEAAFLVTENFFWPNRGGTEGRKGVDERVLAGFQHRQKLVDSGKAEWFVSYGDVNTGILLLRVPLVEYQEFLAKDPWFGLVKREVKTIFNASGHAERFKTAISNVDYKTRAQSPLTSGDLSIASLAPDMAARLLDTDTNGY